MKREKRSDYKFKVGLDIRIKNLMRETSGVCINSVDVTIIWVG